MVQQFKVEFFRYKNGEVRISNPAWIGAEDFNACHGVASLMVIAMRGADPDAEFQISSIDAQHHGTRCDGARMWETAEELTTRFTPVNEPE